MPSSSPRQGVSRNRSLALDDVFKAHREDEDDEDDEDRSRFGTASTIHHLYRPHHRSRDDMSEVGNQSVSTLGASRSLKKTSSTRKESRSNGRAVVKRTSSRRVDHTQSFSATSGLIELLSPVRTTKSADAEEKQDRDEEVSIAMSKAGEEALAGERRRRIPSRAKSSDAILDHKPRGEKKGESSRRTTTTRRNFSHTGGTKGHKKDDSVPDNMDSSVLNDEAIHKRTHQRKPSQSAEESKEPERSGHSRGGEKASSRKTSSRQSSKSNRQNSSSRNANDKDHNADEGTKESKRSAPNRTSSKVSSRTSSKPDLVSSPKRTTKKDVDGPNPSPRRQSSESKRHHHDATAKSSQRGDHATPVRSPAAKKTERTLRQPSMTVDKNKLASAKSERAKEAEDYGYGPGSPGRSPKKSVGRIQMDDHSDASSSIDRYEAEQSSSDDVDGSSGSDMDNTSDEDDGYANPYSRKTRKGKYHDDDEDTVLQFDPTQHGGVQEVKRAGSLHYEFENADGTSIVGQITELADPVGELQMLAAQQENDRRKESLFDFLDGEDGDEDQGRVREPSECDQGSLRDENDTDSQSRGSCVEFQPPMHFEMPADATNFEPSAVADEGRDQWQDSWTKTEDDDPLSPSQDASPRKRILSKKPLRKKNTSNEADNEVDTQQGPNDAKKRGERKASGNDKALISGSRMKVPLSPSKVIAKVKMFSLGDSFNLDKNDDDGEGVEDDIGADDSPSRPSTEAASTNAASPTKDPESPRKAGKKKGKGLGGIGRYFGRSKRHDDDDDMMSVGSTSIGFFNQVKAKHQLLGDDSSVESGVF